MDEATALAIVMKLALDRINIMESSGVDIEKESDALEVIADMMTNMTLGDE